MTEKIVVRNENELLSLLKHFDNLLKEGNNLTPFHSLFEMSTQVNVVVQLIELYKTIPVFSSIQKDVFSTEMAKYVKLTDKWEKDNSNILKNEFGLLMDLIRMNNVFSVYDLKNYKNKDVIRISKRLQVVVLYTLAKEVIKGIVTDSDGELFDENTDEIPYPIIIESDNVYKKE